jgi:hypothetical protein
MREARQGSASNEQAQIAAAQFQNDERQIVADYDAAILGKSDAD